MRLLVTRPEPDASRTAGRLRDLGHEVTVQPLLTIVLSTPPMDVPLPAAILVTSQNALRAIVNWQQVVGWRGVPLFAAGPATAQLAEKLGFRDVRLGAEDAASLANIVAMQVPAGAGPLIYPAAHDRAETLEEVLMGFGYDVHSFDAYRAEAAAAFDPPVRDALAAAQFDGVLLYSRRTAQAFRNLVEAAGLTGELSAVGWYAMSPQVADVMAGMGRSPVIAPRPDEDSLLGVIPTP